MNDNAVTTPTTPGNGPVRHGEASGGQNRPATGRKKITPSTVFDRTAEVIYQHRRDVCHGEPRPCAQALMDAGLLVDADTERLVKLGRAVEALERHPQHMPAHLKAGWVYCLDQIYAQVEP